VVPMSTPDAFLITSSGPGALAIGVGRMYVDGLLAECHGIPPLAYDASLGEVNGTKPVPYNDQPYLPAPLPPPVGTAGTDLLYLDVWEREVTAIEDPHIQEIALGGPDTATRMQTVWQVRDLANVQVQNCDGKIAKWDALTAPSAGRLTTAAVAPPASDDPCIISPAGGYRGLENRLYRIQIHATGTIGGPGAAKFKWSRDNGSVASAVEAIDATRTKVTVKRIGRDQVLRFHIGDWIEVEDDFTEFLQTAGHMTRITAIDEANRILTVSPAVPAGLFDPTNPQRHTRARRWDQKNGVDANGLLSVTAGPIDIEDGVQVTFSLDPAGGNFRVGDYWSFAARTADGSVEELVQAPPRGILHHYARLALVIWSAAGGLPKIIDCRDHWPPPFGGTGECDCCTVTVGDGVDSHGQFTDIQQAINALGDRGGLVCIGRGVYVVNTPITLGPDKSNVIVRGVGPATRIVLNSEVPGASLFVVEGARSVRFESFFAAAPLGFAVMRFTRALDCAVRDCMLVDLLVRDPSPGGTAPPLPSGRVIDLTECAGIAIERNFLLGAKIVAAAEGRLREFLFRDNRSLAVQASILIDQGEGIGILHNQLRSLSRKNLIPPTFLDRANIDQFQAQVLDLFFAPATAADFQAVAVFLRSGRDVAIAHNAMAAQVGVMAFLLIAARIEGNEILALAGLLLIMGLVVRVEGNFIAGLWTGVLQAGVLADFLCESNQFLGLNGIVLVSLAELTKLFSALAGKSLAAFSSSPAGLFTTVSATPAVGGFKGFGLAMVLKLHRNVFFTLDHGVYFSDAVVSFDFAAVENTLLLCRQVGIRLGGGARNPLAALIRTISPRHLIQSNAISAQGRGIQSARALTTIDTNTVTCAFTAVELDATLCAVTNNGLAGFSPEAPITAGLILAHGGATKLTVSGNRLLAAPGHGILIDEDTADLAIENNAFDLARLTAISTAGPATLVDGLRIAGNRIRFCAGGDPQQLWQSGVVTLGSAGNARILDNTLVNNGPTTARPGPFVPVYIEDASDAEIGRNLFAENATLAGLNGLVIGAMLVAAVRGSLRVEQNVVRDSAGGGLFVSARRADVAVRGNEFEGTANTSFFMVAVISAGTLQFENNRVRHAPPGPFGSVGASVLLQAQRATLVSNAVETTGRMGMAISGTESVTSANRVRSAGDGPALQVSAASVSLASSNLTTSFLTVGPVNRVNNFPAP